MWLFRLLLAAVLGVGCAPSAALAWTKAQVRSVEAHLSLEPRAQRAVVALELVVAVRGGWLSQLDLAGLDEGLVLVPEAPAVAVLESGERVAADVRKQDDGALRLSFPRAAGLRRGMHRIQLHYTVNLEDLADGPSDPGTTRLAWTLPGWEAGLDSARIVFEGPKGLAPRADAETASEASVTTHARASGVEFRRLHVPRLSPWSVAVELPSALYVPRTTLRHPAPWRRPTARYATGLWLSLLHLVLLWTWRRKLSTALSREGCAVRGFVFRRPWPPTALCALSLLAAGFWVWALPVALALWSTLPVLGLPRAGASHGALPLGRFVPLTCSQLRALGKQRRAMRIGHVGGDVASAWGVLSVGGLLAGVTSVQGALWPSHDPWGLGVLCALFGMLLSSRWAHPRSVAEQVERLLRAAGAARVVGCALRLEWYLAEGQGRTPRLRIWPAMPYAGLLRLEVCVDSRRDRAPLWLCAVVEAETPTERWLREALPRALVEEGPGRQRICLLCPIDEVGQAVEHVLSHLSEAVQRRVDHAPRSAAA